MLDLDFGRAAFGSAFGSVAFDCAFGPAFDCVFGSVALGSALDCAFGSVAFGSAAFGSALGSAAFGSALASALGSVAFGPALASVSPLGFSLVRRVAFFAARELGFFRMPARCDSVAKLYDDASTNAAWTPSFR